MTRLPLPESVLELLDEGKPVKVEHPDLGSPGHNGTITLDPATEDGYSSMMTVEARVVSVEDDP